MDAAPFTLVRRSPSMRVAHLISGMIGYRELGGGPSCQQEMASLVVPLIISLGTPFRIALGRDPGAADVQPSFAAGLYAGPVHIRSDGGAECVQVDFTPLGAFCMFGGGVADLASRMVDISQVLGSPGQRLREQIGAAESWQRRFDLMEVFVARDAMHRPSPEIVFAYRKLASVSGDARIAALAEEIGWSRKHLVGRFKAEIGLGPKSVARVMRLHRACRLACDGERRGWAGIAAESGYADQAHLTREFVALAGEPPTAWASRRAIADPLLSRSIVRDEVTFLQDRKIMPG